MINTKSKICIFGIIAGAFLTVLCGCFGSKNQEQSNSEIHSADIRSVQQWKQQYIDFINSNDTGSYCLVLVDNDDIPELIYDGLDVADGVNLLWISDNGIEKQHIGYGGFLYYEKQNRFYCPYVNHGIYDDNVYELVDHNVNDLFRGSVLPEENGFENYGWYINSESVSESEYQKQFNSVFDKSKAKSLENFYSKDEIIEMINEY